MIWIIVLIVLIGVWWYIYERKEGFAERPKIPEQNSRIEKIYKNKNLFQRTLYDVRDKFPWMDAIIYEQLRYLIHTNNFTLENIKKIYTNETFGI